MSFKSIAGLCLLAGLSSASCVAATEPAEKPAAYSSSAAAALPEAPAAMVFAQDTGMIRKGADVRPFHSVAVAVNAGIQGIGFDVATSMGKHLNLRGGASFFNYSLSTDSDGVSYDGSLKFRTGKVLLDYYPWAKSFRVSGGMILYNANHVTANATVAGGQSFDLDDTTYYSKNGDPIHGTADVELGNKVAPALTVGWGNMIPRSGKHWSVPFEIGFEYIDRPTLTLNLDGSSCNDKAQLNCGKVNADPSFQANLAGEVRDLNNDLAPLRFFPIVSIGVSYKF